MAALCLVGLKCWACTIVVLADGKTTLFCNNEDWSNPLTRVWVVPGGTNYDACVFVGFDNGWAQGGMNSHGLAFDWVAGGNFEYRLDTRLKSVRGNPSQRMLEQCATVDEAILFYERHREASFARARILVADRSGASAVIWARDGEVYAERSTISRAFGFAGKKANSALAVNQQPTVARGIEILRECAQAGPTATKYSNIFDLNSGEINLFNPGRKDGVKLNFSEELARGGHYYDIPELARQMKKPLQPLLRNMRRLPLDAYRTIPDHAPEITARIRGMLERASMEPLRESDFAPAFWKQIASIEKSVRDQLLSMGSLLSITRVETDPGDGPGSHRYRIDFEYATILVGYHLDEDRRITEIITDDVEQKSR
jgi:hypothetical protein